MNNINLNYNTPVVNPQRTQVDFAPQGVQPVFQNPFYAPPNVGILGPELQGNACTIAENGLAYGCLEDNPCGDQYISMPFKQYITDNFQ